MPYKRQDKDSQRHKLLCTFLPQVTGSIFKNKNAFYLKMYRDLRPNLFWLKHLKLIEFRRIPQSPLAF